jgi:hypothetical protein
MEMWFPESGKVETVLTVLPPEVDKPSGLKGSKMIAIKGGREVLIYGGSSQGVFNSIWNFKVAERSWTLVKNMTQGR